MNILDNTKIEWDQSHFRKADLMVRTLNHKLRQNIVDLINEQPGINVTQIYIKLRIDQSVASQHLTKLKRAGVIRWEWDGQYHRYWVNRDELDCALELIEVLGDQANTK